MVRTKHVLGKKSGNVADSKNRAKTHGTKGLAKTRGSLKRGPKSKNK
jgi:hypothetical protein